MCWGPAEGVVIDWQSYWRIQRRKNKGCKPGRMDVLKPTLWTVCTGLWLSRDPTQNGPLLGIILLKFIAFLNKGMNGPIFSFCIGSHKLFIVLGTIGIASALLYANEGDSVPLDSGHQCQSHPPALTQTLIDTAFKHLEHVLPRGHVWSFSS